MGILSNSYFQRDMLDVDPLTGRPRKRFASQAPMQPPQQSFAPMPPQQPPQPQPFGIQPIDMGQGPVQIPGAGPITPPQADFGSLKQPVPRQAQPGEITDRKPGFMDMFSDREDGFNRNDLLTLGLSLMGNAEQGGDGWSGVARDFSGIMSGVEDRRDRITDRQDREWDRGYRQKAADREDKQFEFEQAQALEADQRADQQYARWQEAVEAAPDEETRQILEAIGPEQYTAYIIQQQEREDREQAAQTDFERQQQLAREEMGFRSREAALDRRSQVELADLRKRDPTATTRGRFDLSQIEPWAAAAATAQSSALPKVQRMKEIISTLRDMGEANQPFDSNTRIFVSRIMQRNPDAQGLMQEYKSLVSSFVRDEAQKIKPVSNIDIKSIENSLPNIETEPFAAYRLLEGMEADMVRGIGRTNAMIDWVDQGYSLAGTDEQGRTFFEAFKPVEPESPARAESPKAASGDAEQLFADLAEAQTRAEYFAAIREAQAAGAPAALIREAQKRHRPPGSGKSGTPRTVDRR